MARLAPAAAHLAQQVMNIDGNAKFKSIGPQDGIGILRTIEFDARTSKWLVPALEAIDDSRITHVQYEGKGRAQVTFIGNTLADRRDDFPLTSVLRVLKGEA